MKQIGIIGGAFNPIHNLHLTVGQLAMEQFKLKRVIFVPSGQPPHKKDTLLSGEKRFKMVKAAVSSNSRFEASRAELDRKGISWSIDTLYEFRHRFGKNTRLNFIVGEDVIDSFTGYERTGEFLSLCRLLVCPRHTVELSELQMRVNINFPEADVEVIDCPPVILSSTLVRGMIAKGHSVKYLVPESVHDILRIERYYR